MMYSIGEMIHKVKISRRTLHYYDEIGLLKPTISRENGYRYYDDQAIIKLQTILSLKSMDYSLEQIKTLFDEQIPAAEPDADPWVPLLQAQIEQASKKIDDLKRKQFILRGVIQTIEMSGRRNDEHVFNIIERIDSPHFVDHEIPATFPADVFTEEEIDALRELPLIGSEDPRLLTALELIKKTRKSMRADEDAPLVEDLAEQWKACISSWFNGDEELQSKYFGFVDAASQESPLIYGLDEEVVRYIDRIMDHSTNRGGDKEHESGKRIR
ncbi:MULTISPECIES: MerR family transcriptional regulator [Paenibacillus]|uniref:MerR family transcriptional regulator n=1 Tax=Paenibacillus TaxID=44249 RepID=UPI00048EE3E0|nr:MerR family transcriptional regulator [Paenibacillus sp. IHBB 10380]